MPMLTTEHLDNILPPLTVCQQSNPFFEMNIVAAILFCGVIMTNFTRRRIAINNKQILYSLSQSKLVGLESSSNWGVLLPNKDGQISIDSNYSIGGFVKVMILSLGPDKKLKLTKKKWKLNKLVILKVDSQISKIQADIATVVQQKLKLQADLEEQTTHTQKVKDMYELIKGFESNLEIVQTYKNIYLKNLKLVSKLKTSQALQDEHIKELLLFIKIAKFDKKNTAISFCKHQEAMTEIKERYLETVDWVKEYLKLAS